MNKTQFKELLYGLPLGIIINDEPIKTLIKNHPSYIEKVGVGIKHIVVRINKLNKRARELYIKRLDDTEVDISWTICFTGKHTSYKQKLQLAMREAIYGQIMTHLIYNQKCVLCNSDERLEIDHKSPSFKDLVEQFQMPFQGVFLDDKFNRPILVPSPEKDSWQAFHLINANLQTLCYTCHKAKTFKRSGNG